MVVKPQTVVTCQYDMYLTDNNAQEELYEQATADRPLIYCHGEGMMLPAFEAALEGKNVGDKFDFHINYQDAYGPYDPDGRITLDKKMFYNGDNEFDSERVYSGAIVPMNTTDGQIVNAQVIEVTDNNVTIDLNHPYAGCNMHFVGSIIDIREATPAELDAIRKPHRCHCSGNCNDCSSDCNPNCGKE